MDLQGWPTGSTAALATEPTNLLPGRIEGWPAGSQRDGTLATDLLAQAVAWWDAAAYRDGDRFLRNRGVAGELLDLRLGSSVVANTNDPTWLGPADQGYVLVTANASNGLSVANSGISAINGDMEIILQFPPGRFIQQRWAGRYGAPGNRSWLLSGNTSQTPGIGLFYDGTNQYTYIATAAIPNNHGWLKVSVDVDNGSNSVVTFSSGEDGVSWTQVGNTITNPRLTTTPAIFSGTADFQMGPIIGGTITGDLTVLRAIVKDGIDGTTVLDVDCDAITSGSATSFTATTGQTVSIARSTSGRKSVAVPARRLGGRPVFLLGSDDFLEVPAESVWQHQLLNFGQGDSFTVLAVVRQWATQVNNARYLSKRASGAGGYVIGPGNTSNGVQFYVEAGTSAPTATQTLGQVSSLVATRTERQAALYVNGVASIASGPSARITSAVPLAVGREGGSGVNYADMEFTAAAIFRRALTAAEIATITTYYTTGG